MNLTIDIGNTAVKVIVFDDTNPVFRIVSKSLKAKDISRLLKFFQIDYCMLSTVAGADKHLLKSLRAIPHFERFSPATKIPVKNLYKTPATLGNDRLANVIAASFLFPRSNVLVIDTGTCIKYDIINSRNEYHGGSISPGMEMRFRALHHFTRQLPMLKDNGETFLTGKTTMDAIQSGVIMGITEEIKGFIQRYKKKFKSLKIILTGGDAQRFAGELKLSIFAAEDLVNLGLNEIIRFNTAKDKKK